MVIPLCNAIALIWRNHFLNYLSIFLKIEAFISLLFNFVLSGAFPLQWLKYFYLFKYFNKDWKSFSTSYSVMQLHPFGATPCPTSQRGISIQREMWKKSEIFPLQYYPKNIILSKNFLQLAQPHGERSQFREKYENNRNLCIVILSKKDKTTTNVEEENRGISIQRGKCQNNSFLYFCTNPAK